MVAILRTLCGCEKAINVSYPPPPTYHVPIHTRPSFVYGGDAMPAAGRPSHMIRRFERRYDEGDYPIYHEVPE